MYWNRHDMGGWDWFTVSVGSVLLWAVLVTVAIMLFRMLSRAPEQTHSPTAATPRQLLAERYARGEIDDEEYRRRLAVLSSEDPVHTKR
ncbi:SHOCT domain-containing protein [Streptomyces sp. NPDC059785]|uniref:SHOCT domain-containing protein n=1 Tax=unclassified Streptomyces TaxID=2593676 RepID=UPI00364B4092